MQDDGINGTVKAPDRRRGYTAKTARGDPSFRIIDSSNVLVVEGTSRNVRQSRDCCAASVTKGGCKTERGMEFGAKSMGICTPSYLNSNTRLKESFYSFLINSPLFWVCYMTFGWREFITRLRLRM